MRVFGTVKVADEVWLAAALLQCEHQDRDAFSPREILDRAARENIVGTLRPGVAIHIYRHAVANLPPDPSGGRYRVLLATPDGRRRLFRPGDPSHPLREGYKTKPDPEGIPERYRYLLQWYEQEYCSKEKSAGNSLSKDHPLVRLIGVGASGRSDVAEHHDRYLAEAGREQG